MVFPALEFEKGGDINRSSYESIHPWFSDLCVHLLNHDSHLFVPHLVAPLGLIDLPGISWSKHLQHELCEPALKAVTRQTMYQSTSGLVIYLVYTVIP